MSTQNGLKWQKNWADHFFDTMAFVLFQHQPQDNCFAPSSTKWRLFSSGINNLVFVLFGHRQHGFCFLPMSTDNNC